MIRSLIPLISGIFLIICFSFLYLTSSQSTYLIPFLFYIVFVMILRIHDLIKHYNKKFYLATGTFFLAIMWIISFIQPILHNIIYYLELVIFTLIIIAMLRSTISQQKKEKNQNKSSKEII